jgi:hypothetical protein
VDPALEEHLCCRYPEILPSYGNPGALHFGIECGNGWFELIEAACVLIQRHQETAKVSPFVARQIKEKFGTLRFYSGGGDAYTDVIVDLTERLSGSLCELCGDLGKTLEQESWLRTRCSTHAIDSTYTAAGTEPEHSALADILAATLNMFGLNAAAAAKWLTSTNDALRRPPLAEAVSERNYEAVLLLIERFDFGGTR